MVILAGVAIAMLASAPNAVAAQTGSKTFSNGAGRLTVSWSMGCGTATTQTTTWQPWANVKLTERGNTTWRKARVAYLVRETEETRIAARYTGTILPPNSVFDPPLWRDRVVPWDPYGGMLDFAPAVGFRVRVSTDGTTFTTLFSHFLNCTNPTP